jgi:hypothetical protein
MDEVIEWAEHLSVLEKAQLLEQLAATLAQDLRAAPAPGGSLYGALADLGPAPSADEIDEVRREMWANVGEGEDY